MKYCGGFLVTGAFALSAARTVTPLATFVAWTCGVHAPCEWDGIASRAGGASAAAANGTTAAVRLALTDGRPTGGGGAPGRL